MRCLNNNRSSWHRCLIPKVCHSTVEWGMASSNNHSRVDLYLTEYQRTREHKTTDTSEVPKTTSSRSHFLLAANPPHPWMLRCHSRKRRKRLTRRQRLANSTCLALLQTASSHINLLQLLLALPSILATPARLEPHVRTRSALPSIHHLLHIFSKSVNSFQIVPRVLHAHSDTLASHVETEEIVLFLDALSHIPPLCVDSHHVQDQIVHSSMLRAREESSRTRSGHQMLQRSTSVRGSLWMRMRQRS